MRNTLLAGCMITFVGMLLLVGGCVQVGGREPLVAIDRTPRPAPANLPPGLEHDVCRQELGNAIARIERLQRDLDDCKRDRNRDKDKWEDEKKRLERERDDLRNSLRRYERN